MNQATTFTLEQQQKKRMKLLMIMGLLASCVIPMLVAAYLGRERNLAVMVFGVFMLGGIIGGLGLSATFGSDEEWRKELRVLARGAAFIGIPFLLAFNLCITSALVPMMRNEKPGIAYKAGEYLVVERADHLEVLVDQSRYNFTDHLVMTIPGAISFWDLQGVADGKDIRVMVQTERQFKKQTPSLVLPADGKALLTLYQRTLGQQFKEVMAGQIAGLAVRYLESLPAEDRMGVKKLTLVWDIPVNDAFHGIGARLEGSNELTLLVKVLPKPVEVLPNVIRQNHDDNGSRIVRVSSLR